MSTKIDTIILSTTETAITLGPCIKEGPCRNCHYALNIPAYMPKLVGTIIAVVVAIFLFILYLFEEKRKEKMMIKTKKSLENEQEKNDRDAIAFGHNNVEYVIEQSTCGTPKNMGGGFKVLEKKPKPKCPPQAPPITPFSVNNNKGPRVSRVRTTKKEEAALCQIQITADRMGRGLELASLLNETDIPGTCISNEEKANYALDNIRGHLEKMTEEKFVIYALLDEKQWLFNGSEHLLAEFSELRLELKMLMTTPVNLQIQAFSVKGDTAHKETVPQKLNSSSKAVKNTEPNIIMKEIVEKLTTPGNSTAKKPTFKKTPQREDLESKQQAQLEKFSSKQKHTKQEKSGERKTRATPIQKSPEVSSRTTGKTMRTEHLSIPPMMLKKRLKEISENKKDDAQAPKTDKLTNEKAPKTDKMVVEKPPKTDKLTIEKTTGSGSGKVIQL